MKEKTNQSNRFSSPMSKVMSLLAGSSERSKAGRLSRGLFNSRRGARRFKTWCFVLFMAFALLSAMIPHNLNAAAPVPAPQTKGGGGGDITPNFFNPNAIVINASGAATPYPSNITVSGVVGTISKVTVTIFGLSHTDPDDVDILLVGPGANTILVADAGGATDAVNVTLTFDQQAANTPPDTGGINASGTTVRPVNHGGGDPFTGAPAPSGTVSLNNFNGTTANGTWSLYVFDDDGGDAGTIAQGWAVNISTQSTITNAAAIAIPGTGTGPGNANPCPSDIVVSGLTGLVSRVTVTITDLTHSFPDDIDMELVSPSGARVVLMSECGGNPDIINVDLTFDDTAANNLPDSTIITSGTFRPTDFVSGPADTYCSPGGAPTGTTMATFNGTAPNGTWSLCISDDQNGDSGSIASWTLNISVPTAVELASFEATSYDSGTFIEWTTGFEVDNLGFNVYREEAGRRARINSSLVAGSALLAGSRNAIRSSESYGWWEPSAPSKHMVQYWLEDVDLNGKRTLHGPITAKQVGGSPPTTGRAALLSQRGAGSGSSGSTTATAQSQGGARTAANNIAVQWDLASRAAVKISIRKDGWYRVTQPDLVAAGLDASRDPRFLQLFADGQELPIAVNGGASGRFEAGDSIEFYATALDTPYTDARVYWLVSGSQQGRRIPQVSLDGKPSQAASFPATVERRDRTIYFAALNNGEADNFFGPVITAEPVSQAIAVRHLDTASAGDATLEVALQGVTDLAGDTPDHSVSVMLNGAQVGSVSFDGRERKVSLINFSSLILQEGDNSVTFAAQGGETDVSMIDYVRLTYAHTFKAENDQLRLTTASQQALRITGFDNDQIRVFDITDVNNPQEITAATEADGAGFAVTFTPTGAGTRVLYAISNKQASPPAQVAANQPSAWNRAAQGTDALVITHRDFAAAVNPLVLFRRGQGYSVSVVEIEDLYDEFNYGARSPQSVRDFLTRANSTWKRRPRFVLFVGDASFDPRDYLGLGNWDLVPTKLVGTTMLETSSDDWFTDFNGDSAPEIATGRLPARSPGEAALMAAKIIAYERGPRAEGVVMVADKNEEYDFEDESRSVSAIVPAGVAVKEIFRGPLGDVTARSELLAAITRAPKIVNYIGHGSVGVWRGNLLTSEDGDALSGSQGPSLFVAMTCLNGFFHDQFGESLAEFLLKIDNGGAVAVWASSSLTESGTQAVMNQELYRQLFNNNATIGEAAMRAKAFVGSSDIRQSWVLFGDPMTRLK